MLVLLAAVVTLLIASLLLSISGTGGGINPIKTNKLSCDVTIRNPLFKNMFISETSCAKQSGFCILNTLSLPIFTDVGTLKMSYGGTATQKKVEVPEGSLLGGEGIQTVSISVCGQDSNSASLKLYDVDSKLISSAEVNI